MHEHSAGEGARRSSRIAHLESSALAEHALLAPPAASADNTETNASRSATANNRMRSGPIQGPSFPQPRTGASPSESPDADEGCGGCDAYGRPREPPHCVNDQLWRRTPLRRGAPERCSVG